METIEDKVERAHRDADYQEIADSIIAEAKTQAPERGFEIDKVFYSGFHSQGDGASWVGVLRPTAYIEWKLENGGIEGLENVTLEVMFWLFNAGVFDNKLDITSSGYYTHEQTMTLSDIYWSAMGANDVETLGVWGGPFEHTPVKELLKASGWSWETEMDDSDNYNRLWSHMLNDARDFAKDLYKRLEDAYEEVYFD